MDPLNIWDDIITNRYDVILWVEYRLFSAIARTIFLPNYGLENGGFDSSVDISHLANFPFKLF